MAQATEYDGIVLDVGLPDESGIELCRRLRAHGIDTPVLMLTARTSVTDRVSGLDAGADDYLAKPFDMQELFARVRAMTRRGAAPHTPVLAVGDLRLDPASRRVEVAGNEVELVGKEFAMLETLMRDAGNVVSRFALLEHVWDGDSEHSSNVITVYIKNIRAKIDTPDQPSHIETIRGAGYRLRTSPT